ncbi:tRNA (adenosine(37)-N6)-threonylcarbamoyltransferase complex transferase subunit TsaD [Desulfobacter hydrogenophilus]|uniref:tRNA N6-adenosine threonylcarbamoyltransferase n=1 Tax=Desulfobacter hydrogenophilus TaxID=2291 RepID=A0A328FEY3_9BACT|nr:tRNA (adenosine(37)-N6)-threonylcarbamoyltransferase complex transferase subunit TsaD [Desulfobacter hydrogenophilus]NDY72525.1 tRNA (adenosine(37)-N6)-threonylcarbamoyltransferase complex transferase subunit TsaD [Desulfobacter hydrogenophilus]QBH14144.1 tRNA (adenosine(37)-N6)-threonylcarbamoyltransferase complex transferase subunit TsaD [Desulfobacter hydrogenophilus]RAM01567.1 tRNA (adenosine(37)-N6)-threonylcarbamoyltransferase complex transferase subunit TsaD [Desulfobacter hydrogenophi
MLILGIESSCDETAAAVVEDGVRTRSSVVSSQVSTHAIYGGVVPELASRMHIEAIDPVVDQALAQAGVSLDDIDGIAATQGPGLIGALLVGFSYARALAWARNLPLAGVNHLEAHICSLQLLDHRPSFPFIALVVSGGHTNIYLVKGPGAFTLMGQTRDDAAGEAFDKVAKMMGLSYPGGPAIEALAKNGDPEKIKFPRSMLKKDNFDFSFSGLKSAVARHLHEHPDMGPDMSQGRPAHVAAGFQMAVIDVLSTKLIAAAKNKNCFDIGIAGGVSANRTFVDILSKRAERYKMKVFSPPLSLCGDNAAMIAARGWEMIRDNQVCGLGDDVYSRIKSVVPIV